MNIKCLIPVIAILFICPPVTQAKEWPATAEKKITRRYNVQQADKLIVDNTYGRIILRVGNKNKMTAEITMTAKARTDNDAKELLDRISIDESNKNNRIYFKTEIEKNRRNINNSEFTINYVIEMPWENAVDLANKYGNVYILDRDGQMDVNVAYGNVLLSGSHGQANIKVAFGNADVTYVNKGRFDISYGNLVLKDGSNLDITNKYGNTTIATVQNLQIRQEYGNLVIKSVNKIDGTLDFSDMTIAKLNNSLGMTLKYAGKATILEVEESVTSLKMKAQYSDVSLHLAEGVNMSMDITVSYGDLKNKAIRKYFEPMDKDDDGSNVLHCHGKAGTGEGSMVLTASYGDIIFK